VPPSPPPRGPGRRRPGRDAIEVVLLTSFGPVTLTEFEDRAA
jgi:hypothetical protein